MPSTTFTTDTDFSARLRILCVDDYADLAALWVFILCRAGYDAVCATSCQDARALLKNERWDMLITDLEIGDGTGWELCGIAYELDPQLPVIIVSGVNEMIQKPDNFCHIKALLTKPLDSQLLLQTVISYLPTG